jgi:hypothetical protein
MDRAAHQLRLSDAYIPGRLGAAPSLLSPSPHSFPSDMPTNVDPATICVSPNDLSKLTKKELAQHLSSLQGMYAERDEKYGA